MFKKMTNEIVRIEANNNASQRTKNRIREHGELFILRDRAGNVQSLSGNPGILVEAFGPDLLSPNDDDWFGWFPESEVTVSKV